ncbi:MAG TPA: arsinothricin resistance N-acetyltransferase ArsN1 family A [Rubrobacter sp.]|nr:arsinothricin resistance N-acetyltransferase ArsN1 family A [Rubrobacter sp.]
MAPQGAARGGRSHAVGAIGKNGGEDTVLKSRAASPEDAEAIVRIYNEGIEERIATFETSLRTAREIEAWFSGTHPVVVVEEEGRVISFANTTPYSPRACYAGVAEFSVYTASEARGRGAGTLAMETLLQAAEEAGFWKLVARVFVENEPSRKLLLSLGFREVGVHVKHARLEGVWRDVVVVERLLPANT